MRGTHLARVFWIVVALSACALVDDDAPQSLPALIIFYGDTATLTLPDSVKHTASFDVRVKTFAGGCIRETAPAQTIMRDRTAEIRLYNVGQGQRGTVCTADLLFLSHTVPIVFDSAGSATIRVIGGRQDASTAGGSVADTLEWAITVR